MRYFTKTIVCASLALLAHTGAQALPVEEVSYESLIGTRVDFSSLPEAGEFGRLLDGLVSAGGVQFGERFAGQELAVTKAPRPGEVAQDWFDDLSFGAPNASLTLLAGGEGANLGVFDYGDLDGKALAGIGPINGDGSDPFGLGAISGRFSNGQSALGFQIRDADGGNAVLRLYRADGSLIQALSLGPVENSFYAFARSGGEADIAGFSLYNADSYYGIAIDNLTYGGVTAVPEPATVLLLLAGLLTLGGATRRRPR